jgi:hypothetical protein
MKNWKDYLLIGFLTSGMILASCSDDDVPAEENEEEVIDFVTLTFTPQGGGTAVIASATDPDGEGAADFTIETIDLAASTSYTLTLTIENSAEGENITEEIEEESDEHMFFFAFTADIFSDPTGNGNVDNRMDDVNYNDQDMNGQPLGLTTSWTTSNVISSDNDFRVVLKHQPGFKSATSTSNDGESDIDLTFSLDIN